MEERLATSSEVAEISEKLGETNLTSMINLARHVSDLGSDIIDTLPDS